MNLGPVVLTVLQFVAAAAGYVLVAAIVPEGTEYRGAALFVGVVASVLLVGLGYRRYVREALPARVRGGTPEETEAPTDDGRPPGVGSGPPSETELEEWARRERERDGDQDRDRGRGRD